MKSQPQRLPIVASPQLVKTKRQIVGGKQGLDVQSVNPGNVRHVRHVANPRVLFEPVREACSILCQHRTARRALGGMLGGDCLEHLVPEQPGDHRKIVVQRVDAAAERSVAINAHRPLCRLGYRRGEVSLELKQQGPDSR
jgi:hypothetical protein